VFFRSVDFSRHSQPRIAVNGAAGLAGGGRQAVAVDFDQIRRVRVAGKPCFVPRERLAWQLLFKLTHPTSVLGGKK